jgi:hypothetical protein
MQRSTAYLAVVGVVALVAALAGIAQAAPVTDRPMQRGTKTVVAMYVAYAGRTSGPDEIDAQISQTLEDLWAFCVDNGLHPAGPPTVAAETVDEAAQLVRWEAWLPLADQPSADDLANEGPVPIKRVPETTVAFTYHAGDPAFIGDTFAALANWAGAQGLTLSGRARVVVNMTPTDGEVEHFIRECQLEILDGAAVGE